MHTDENDALLAYEDAYCRDCGTSPCAGTCAPARTADADAALALLDELRAGSWPR